MPPSPSTFVRPRRSLLFVPGSHARAMEKAKRLCADVIVFDLEDGVADTAKKEARERIRDALTHRKTYGWRELIVRINPLSSTLGLEDFSALAGTEMNGLMLPKVESAREVDHAASLLNAHGFGSLPIWANVETPRGVLQAGDIAAHSSCFALVAGTNDLRAALKLTHSNDRSALTYSLQAILCAARAYDKLAFDGTYISFDDPAGLETECLEGRRLGFDGKTLVHPEQINIANEVFSPTEEEVAEARAIIHRYEDTLERRQSVDILDGRMIEELHVRRAQDVLALHRAIEKISGLK